MSIRVRVGLAAAIAAAAIALTATAAGAQQNPYNGSPPPVQPQVQPPQQQPPPPPRDLGILPVEISRTEVTPAAPAANAVETTPVAAAPARQRQVPILPLTGTDIAGLVLIGGALTAGGVALHRSSRRRAVAPA